MNKEASSRMSSVRTRAQLGSIFLDSSLARHLHLLDLRDPRFFRRLPDRSRRSHLRPIDQRVPQRAYDPH